MDEQHGQSRLQSCTTARRAWLYEDTLVQWPPPPATHATQAMSCAKPHQNNLSPATPPTCRAFWAAELILDASGALPGGPGWGPSFSLYLATTTCSRPATAPPFTQLCGRHDALYTACEGPGFETAVGCQQGGRPCCWLLPCRPLTSLHWKALPHVGPPYDRPRLQPRGYRPPHIEASSWSPLSRLWLLTGQGTQGAPAAASSKGPPGVYEGPPAAAGACWLGRCRGGCRLRGRRPPAPRCRL
jgi:hypothetical protein